MQCHEINGLPKSSDYVYVCICLRRLKVSLHLSFHDFSAEHGCDTCCVDDRQTSERSNANRRDQGYDGSIKNAYMATKWDGNRTEVLYVT